MSANRGQKIWCRGGFGAYECSICIKGGDQAPTLVLCCAQGLSVVSLWDPLVATLYPKVYQQACGIRLSCQYNLKAKKVHDKLINSVYIGILPQGLFKHVCFYLIIHHLNWNAFQVVLVTGASSGLGEALARVFYQAGCLVVLAARRESELERVKKELLASHLDKVRTMSNELLPIFKSCKPLFIIIINISFSATMWGGRLRLLRVLNLACWKV